MKLKMRKIKSWLRWGKKRYEEKLGIKIKEIRLPKSQLLMVQQSQLLQKKQRKLIKKAQHKITVDIKRILKKRYKNND